MLCNERTSCNNFFEVLVEVPSSVLGVVQVPRVLVGLKKYDHKIKIRYPPVNISSRGQ